MQLKNTGIAIGAVVGGLAGLLGVLAMMPKNQAFIERIKDQAGDWIDSAREMGETVYEKSFAPEPPPNYFGIGTAVGLLLGVGSAILLSTKKGKQVRRDITKTYRGVANKTYGIFDFANHNGRARKVVRSAARKAQTLKRNAKKVVKSPKSH